MPGIYLHIPFCKKACTYCDFHFSVNHNRIDDLVISLTKDIELNKTFFTPNTQLDSIYFGGGTPSLLSKSQLSKILDSIVKYFDVKSSAEITLEANPDDISVDFLKNVKKSGINRLSIGVQSFFENDLQFMGRAHTAIEATKSIQLAAEAGFNNISIDLIYGLPNQSADKWSENLHTAFDLPIQHLSCYGLTVEDKTKLKKLVQNKDVIMPSDRIVNEQFDLLSKLATEYQFEHYEISNLSKPGSNSLHNSSYWKGENYLGIGPSAHSFDGNSRRWNVRSNASYINSLLTNKPYSEEENLTTKQRVNEFLMTRLRTRRGIFTDELNSITLERDYLFILNKLNNLSKTEYAINNNGQYYLTISGWKICDSITSELFL